MLKPREIRRMLVGAEVTTEPTTVRLRLTRDGMSAELDGIDLAGLLEELAPRKRKAEGSDEA